MMEHNYGYRTHYLSFLMIALLICSGCNADDDDLSNNVSDSGNNHLTIMRASRSQRSPNHFSQG